ncbi:MAG: ABC transporter substrate-binding protein [Chthoniobacteraceae bacterium]
MTRPNFIRCIATTALALAFTGCEKKPADTSVLRVGFFPNITHAPALVGYHETDTKGAAGWFETRTGARIEWYPFNAGPSAIEALFTGSIDVTYVGPNPVINGYTRSKGADIRVLTGAARGGAALVVHRDSPLRSAANFRGRKIATPQLGGTQDVAARAWLAAGGLAITQRGGDANVIPTANPDQLDLFKRGDLDAVWTVEPWVSRLEMEAGGQMLVEQKDVLTTLVATSTKTLATKGELLKKFIAAHGELTKKIAAEPGWAKSAVSAALQKVTGKGLAAALLDHAWPRLTFTTDIQLADFAGIQRDAKSAGLLPMDADLSKLFAK